MTTTANIEQIAQRAIEAFNAHDAKAWGALYASDAVVTDPQYPEPLRGRDAIEKDFQDFLTAFGDLQGRTTSLLVQGNTYVWEGVASGTHTGPMEVPGQTIPPTNRRMEFPGCFVGAVNDQGQIMEERRYYDVATILGQLGLLD